MSAWIWALVVVGSLVPIGLTSIWWWRRDSRATGRDAERARQVEGVVQAIRKVAARRGEPLPDPDTLRNAARRMHDDAS